MHWKKITVAGVGLLGGSLGLAAKRRRLADVVAGFVRRAASVTECQRLEVLDLATRDLPQAVQGAELVVLCTPIAQMRGLVEKMLPSFAPGTIVTDVGSVKGSVVKDLERLVARAGAHFIGSHPMAGAEKMGVSAARPDLFVDAVCVITPTAASHRPALRKVERFWGSVGARVLRLSPQEHDELVSRSSHLPHLLAAQLVNLVLNPKRPKPQALLCANGFRDTTRIASGSPEMWRDIAMANRSHLLRALDEFGAELKKFRGLLQRADADAIAVFFERAKERRDQWAGKTGAAGVE